LSPTLTRVVAPIELNYSRGAAWRCAAHAWKTTSTMFDTQHWRQRAIDRSETRMRQIYAGNCGSNADRQADRRQVGWACRRSADQRATDLRSASVASAKTLDTCCSSINAQGFLPKTKHVHSNGAISRNRKQHA